MTVSFLGSSLDSSSAAGERRGWKYRSAIFYAKIALVLRDSAIIHTPNRKVLRATVTMTGRRVCTGCLVQNKISFSFSLFVFHKYTFCHLIL